MVHNRDKAGDCENCGHPIAHHDKDGKCDHWMHVFYDTPVCNCRRTKEAQND